MRRAQSMSHLRSSEWTDKWKGSTALDWTSRAKPTVDGNSFPLSRACTIGFAKTIPSGIQVQEYAPKKYRVSHFIRMHTPELHHFCKVLRPWYSLSNMYIKGSRKICKTWSPLTTSALYLHFMHNMFWIHKREYLDIQSEPPSPKHTHTHTHTHTYTHTGSTLL